MCRSRAGRILDVPLSGSVSWHHALVTEPDQLVAPPGWCPCGDEARVRFWDGTAWSGRWTDAGHDFAVDPERWRAIRDAMLRVQHQLKDGPSQAPNWSALAP